MDTWRMSQAVDTAVRVPETECPRLGRAWAPYGPGERAGDGKARPSEAVVPGAAVRRLHLEGARPAGAARPAPRLPRRHRPHDRGPGGPRVLRDRRRRGGGDQ